MFESIRHLNIFGRIRELESAIKERDARIDQLEKTSEESVLHLAEALMMLTDQVEGVARREIAINTALPKSIVDATLKEGLTHG